MIILSTYKGPGDYPQLNAVRSWQNAFPSSLILLFYTEKECPYTMRALEEQCHRIVVQRLTASDCTDQGTPVLSRMLKRARHKSNAGRTLMWINSDIIIGQGAWRALVPALRHEEPFFMTGQRWDVQVDRFLADEELLNDNFLKEMARAGKLLPPCGADWFYFDKRLFHDLPDFAIGRCTFDQAMIWDAIQKDVPHRFNMTQHVLAIHQTHPESPESRLNEEAQENVRLMKEWYSNWTVGWDGWVNQLPAPTRIDGVCRVL